MTTKLTQKQWSFPTGSKDKAKTVREIQNANLQMWKPGQSGNPAGMKKGSKNGLRARLNQALEKQITPNLMAHLKQEGIDLESNENAEAIAYVAINLALFGDISAIKLIADQTESPMPKDVNLNTKVQVELIQRHIVDVKEVN